jgi:hypothetical protein
LVGKSLEIAEPLRGFIPYIFSLNLPPLSACIYMDSQNSSLEDLHLTWICTTYALISAGHTTDLYQALDKVLGISHESQVHGYYLEDPLTALNPVEPRADSRQRIALDRHFIVPSENSLSPVANRVQHADSDYPNVEIELTPPEENNDLTSPDIDESWSTLSPTESETSSWLGVPSELVYNSADLSTLRADRSSPSFEDILATEESLPFVSELDDNTPAPFNEGVVPAAVEVTRSLTPVPEALSIPISTLHTTHNSNNATDHTYCRAVGADGHPPRTLHKAYTFSPQSVAIEDVDESAKNTKPGRIRPLRISVKRNLIDAEISPVAQILIQGDAFSNFFKRCQLIQEGVPSFTRTVSLSSKTNVEESVIAAFDTLHELRERKNANRLVQRFAFVRLIRTIEILKAAAKRDRTLGHDCREVGHGDTTIAIDLYLRNKGNHGPSRSKLYEYIRKGMRWDAITAPSLLILCLYLDRAETVVYVSPM